MPNQILLKRFQTNSQGKSCKVIYMVFNLGILLELQPGSKECKKKK